jgi:hypothetical protein
VNGSKFQFAFGLAALLMLAPAAEAQRVDVGEFAGIWKGTLTMDVMYDVPPEHAERLKKPVEIEVRIFARGGAELYFTFEENEWEFSVQRDFRITPIPDQSGTVRNGVIPARLPGNNGWISSMTLNLTLQSENELLLSWSRLTVRDNLLYDGLDELGFGGIAVLSRAADEDD